MSRKLPGFWQELKRRRVIKVIIMYAGVAYVLIELSSNVTGPLRLPEWTPTLVILLLVIGFPIVLFLSWIFDITPEGIRKTESTEFSSEREPVAANKSESEHEPGSEHEPVRAGKLLSTSNIIITLLLGAVLILLYPKIFHTDQFKELRDESGLITVAVLPFDNLTGDSSLYFWQNGISEYLINRLGSSEELAVSSSQVISDVLAGTREVNTASLSPEVARKTAAKINASIYATGKYIGVGKDVSIMLNLVNTENGELIWSTSVDGDLGGDYRALLTSLSDTVRNYLEIKSLEKKAEPDLSSAYPNSAEAYRYYIDGLNAIVASDYKSAIASLQTAYEIDTTFTFAAFYLAFAHSFSGQFDENLLYWTRRAHELRNNLPPAYRPWIELWYACYITKDLNDIRRYCTLMYEAALHSRLLWFDLGVTCTDFLDDFQKAIGAYEHLEALNRQWEDDWKYSRYYQEYAWALLMADRPEDVARIAEIGLRVNPEDDWLNLAKGAAAIMMNDTASMYRYNETIRKRVKEYYLLSDAFAEHSIGLMHCWAKDTIGAIDYFKRAFEMDRERLNSLSMLIQCQLKSNINPDECLKLSEYGLEQNPESVGFLWEKGVSLHKLGRNQEALGMLREVEDRWTGYHKYLRRDIQEVERALALQE